MENIEITDKIKLDIKRFYLPVIIKRDCPCCNNLCEVDLNLDYLSYPILNKNKPLYFYCDECDQEFEIDLILQINLQAGTETHEL